MNEKYYCEENAKSEIILIFDNKKEDINFDMNLNATYKNEIESIEYHTCDCMENKQKYHNTNKLDFYDNDELDNVRNYNDTKLL